MLCVSIIIKFFQQDEDIIVMKKNVIFLLILFLFGCSGSGSSDPNSVAAEKLVEAVNISIGEDGATYAEEATTGLGVLYDIDLSSVSDDNIKTLYKNYEHYFMAIKQEGIKRDDGLATAGAKWLFDSAFGNRSTLKDLSNIWQDWSGETNEMWENIRDKYGVSVKEHGIINGT
jgi:hypothetical protein